MSLYQDAPYTCKYFTEMLSQIVLKKNTKKTPNKNKEKKEAMLLVEVNLFCHIHNDRLNRKVKRQIV